MGDAEEEPERRGEGRPWEVRGEEREKETEGAFLSRLFIPQSLTSTAFCFHCPGPQRSSPLMVCEMAPGGGV